MAEVEEEDWGDSVIILLEEDINFYSCLFLIFLVHNKLILDLKFQRMKTQELFILILFILLEKIDRETAK